MMVVLVVAGKLDVEPRVNGVGAGQEPFDGIAAVITAAFHGHLDTPTAVVGPIGGEDDAPAMLLPLFHVAGFKVVRKEHGGIFVQTGVARITGGEADSD